MLEGDDDLEIMFALVVRTSSHRVDISVIDYSNSNGILDNCYKNEDFFLSVN